jgi:hypothetical protein
MKLGDRLVAMTRLMVLDHAEMARHNALIKDPAMRTMENMPFRLEVSSDGGETWAPVFTKGGLRVSQSKADLLVVETGLPIDPRMCGRGVMHAVPGADGWGEPEAVNTDQRFYVRDDGDVG